MGICMIYLYKEILESLRYKVIWINLFLIPFFQFAPFVLMSADPTQVLIGLICWYVLTQYFFVIPNCFEDERINGTIVNLLTFPISVIRLLISKGIWLAFQTIAIVTFTLLLFSLFNITVKDLPLLLALVVFDCFAMFCCSVFYLGLVLHIQRFSRINGFIQDVLGFFSGYTFDIRKFPIGLRLISYLIPLTYIIIIARHSIGFTPVALMMVTILSLMLLFLGLHMVNQKIQKLRSSGEWNIW